MAHESDGEREAAVFQAQFPLIDRILNGILGALQRKPNSDVVEDCRLEARLTLWLVRARLAELTEEGDRRRYAGGCIRHAIQGVLRAEFRRTRDSRSLEELGSQTGPDASLVDERAADALERIGDRLLDVVGEERIVQALRTLSAAELTLLDLTYVDRLTDQEIGRLLGISADAVKMRRQRVLRKLQRLLGIETNGGGRRRRGEMAGAEHAGGGPRIVVKILSRPRYLGGEIWRYASWKARRSHNPASVCRSNNPDGGRCGGTALFIARFPLRSRVTRVLECAPRPSCRPRIWPTVRLLGRRRMEECNAIDRI